MNDQSDTSPDASGDDQQNQANVDRAPMTLEELEKILTDHRVWRETDWKDGERANLQGANLEGANLSGAELCDANLEGANLEGADLSGADLSWANLLKAFLLGADLHDANLFHSWLSWATLREANLSDAKLEAANLYEANLYCANLQRASLGFADLQGANLRRALLHRVDLQGANLLGADLSLARFERLFEPAMNTGRPLSTNDIPLANLSSTILRNTNLSDASLASVTGLQSHQLAGANLSGAKLPEDIKGFAGLTHVEELSKHARNIFFGLIGGCIFSWLTIGTTTDAALITNSTSTPLPIIQTNVPIAGFYLAAPMILLALYVYLHFYLQRLWEGLGNLPAIFPDGRTLDERAHPWLLTSLVRSHVPLLKERQPAFSKSMVQFSILAAWGLVPVTIFLLWLRYLPVHGWRGTALLSGALFLSIWLGVVFYQRAARTLRGDAGDRPAITPGPAIPITLHATLVVVAIIAGTFTAEKRSDLNLFGTRLFAVLGNIDVSTRSANWTGMGTKKEVEAQIAQVKGAILNGANLRFAFAPGAFLVKAQLRLADLKGADLRGVNLHSADLFRANLQSVTLFQANLTSARLIQVNLAFADLLTANLSGANLLEANLEKANLQGADLQGAILQCANLQGADLQLAKLQNADLRGANLTDALLLGANLRGARFWTKNTKGPALIQAMDVACQKLRSAHNWMITPRDPDMACGAPIPKTEPTEPEVFRIPSR